jgi:hypothetical protein
LLSLCGPCLTTDTAENRQGKRYKALIFWALFYQEKSARKIGAQAIPPSSHNKAALAKRKSISPPKKVYNKLQSQTAKCLPNSEGVIDH